MPEPDFYTGEKPMKPYGKFPMTVLVAVSLTAVGLSACTVADRAPQNTQAAQASDKGPSVGGPPGTWTYIHLYATPDGETHYRNESVSLAAAPFAPPAQPIAIGGAQAASRVLFLGFQPRWGEHDLAAKTPHPTPIRQFITVLQGTLTIYASDGAVRRFNRGDIFLVDDADSKGHVTVVGDEPTILQACQIPVSPGR